MAILEINFQSTDGKGLVVSYKLIRELAGKGRWRARTKRVEGGDPGDKNHKGCLPGAPGPIGDTGPAGDSGPSGPQGQFNVVITGVHSLPTSFLLSFLTLVIESLVDRTKQTLIFFLLES